MNRFAPILKKINEKLDLPQPQKSRVILEIAADLEDLYKIYLNRGLDEDEAARRAAEKFDLDSKTLAELVTIHQSVFQKLFHGISANVQKWWERGVLAVVLLIILLLTFKVTMTLQFFTHASIFVWPMLAIFILIIVLFFVKTYKLFIKQAHSINKVRAGVPFILFLICINFILGTLGYIVELYASGADGYILTLWGVLMTRYDVMKADSTNINIIQWHIKYASVALMNIAATVIAAVMWFILSSIVHKIEQDEVSYLLE